MRARRSTGVARALEEYLERTPHDRYVLRLYVTGATPTSTRAIANLKELCERRLHGRYQLEVIDILQRPALAEGEQIVAAPTLVKALPPPLRRFIGDLSGLEDKLLGLDLRVCNVDEPVGAPAVRPG